MPTAGGVAIYLTVFVAVDDVIRMILDPVYMMKQDLIWVGFPDTDAANHCQASVYGFSVNGGHS